MQSYFFAVSIAATRKTVSPYGMNHCVQILGFKKPLNETEAVEEAMKICMKTLPEADGWSNHSVSATPFDPHSLAKQLDELLA